MVANIPPGGSPVPHPKANNASILALFLVLFVVSVGFGIIIPLLPLITREFGASAFMLGAMTAGYAVLQFLFAPLWGQLSDRIGRKPVLMIGITGISLSFLFMGLARSFWALFAARVMGGFLGSATMPAAQALAAELSSSSNRAKAMGLMGAAFGTGFIFGPLVGGVLSPLGMSVPMFAGAAFGFANVLLSALVLREPQAGQRQQEGPERRSTFKYIAVALRGPGGPFYHLAFIIMFCQSCLMTSLALYLTDRFGIGTSTIGAIFALNGFIGALVQGAAIGRITDRLGERGTIRTGLVLGMIAYASIVLAPTLTLATGAIVLTALSMSLTRPAATSLLSQVTPLPQGITMGVQGSFDSLGRVVGPLWAGFAYDQMQALPFLTAAAAYALYFAVHMRRPSEKPAPQPDPGVGA